MSLKQQTYSAIRWTTLAMIGKSALQFLQVAILARLLTPADFGLMALVIVVITFVQIFTDMGLSNAIIHHQQVSQEELSSLYWLNVLAGAILMLMVILVSPLVARLYAVPALQPLLMVVSIYILVGAIGQLLIVMAEKELQFAVLARIELLSASVGLAVSVVWAWLAPSVAALIAGMIASMTTMTLLCWLMLANGWRPMWRLRLGEVGHFVKFGGYTMANNLVNTINTQADIIIGGRFLSASSLGMYSLPRDLSLRVASVINPIVTRVGFPVMAKAQADKAFLKDAYLKTTRMIASVNFPIYMAISIFAPEVISLLFGNHWNDAIPLLRVLAVWGLLRSVGNPIGSLVFAVGRADLAFKWNLALVFMVLPAIWVGAQHGNEGLAMALILTSLFLVVPGWYVLVRPLCGAGFFEYFQQLLIPLLISFLSTIVAFAVTSPLTEAALRLGLGLASGGVAYILLSRWLNAQWFDALCVLLLRKR